MKIWFDTEFIEDGKTIDLISIGMVREDGATLYFENTDCDLNKANDWVKSNVFPNLKTVWTPKHQIASHVREFAGDKPEFWAYYADYDWVVLCQLYGAMIDLPKGWPMMCMDVKQYAILLGDPELPKQKTAEHNALNDALWTRKAWGFLNQIAHRHGIVI